MASGPTPIRGAGTLAVEVLGKRREIGGEICHHCKSAECCQIKVFHDWYPILTQFIHECHEPTNGPWRTPDLVPRSDRSATERTLPVKRYDPVTPVVATSRFPPRMSPYVPLEGEALAALRERASMCGFIYRLSTGWYVNLVGYHAQPFWGHLTEIAPTSLQFSHSARRLNSEESLNEAHRAKLEVPKFLHIGQTNCACSWILRAMRLIPRS